MIISVQNPRVQWVRKLQAQAKVRRQEQAFVVEGVRLVEEALDAGWQVRLVLYTHRLNERGFALVERFQRLGVPVESVSSEVMEAASDTQTPQGVLAVVGLRASSLPPAADFLLVVDGLRDPGNLGPPRPSSGWATATRSGSAPTSSPTGFAIRLPPQSKPAPPIAMSKSPPVEAACSR